MGLTKSHRSILCASAYVFLTVMSVKKTDGSSEFFTEVKYIVKHYKSSVFEEKISENCLYRQMQMSEYFTIRFMNEKTFFLSITTGLENTIDNSNNISHIENQHRLFPLFDMMRHANCLSHYHRLFF